MTIYLAFLMRRLRVINSHTFLTCFLISSQHILSISLLNILLLPSLPLRPHTLFRVTNKILPSLTLHAVWSHLLSFLPKYQASNCNEALFLKYVICTHFLSFVLNAPSAQNVFFYPYLFRRLTQSQRCLQVYHLYSLCLRFNLDTIVTKSPLHDSITSLNTLYFGGIFVCFTE